MADHIRLAWAAKKPELAVSTRDQITKAALGLTVAGIALAAAARRVERWGLGQ